MKAWAEFHPHVLPYVIGCPNPTVDAALRDAAREFCLDSKAWVETEDFEADGETNRYFFDVTGRTELVQVIRASVAGVDLDLFGRRQLPADWETIPPCSGLYHLNAEEYLLFPRPAAGAAVSVTLAYQPSLIAPGVGDRVFKDFAAAIAAGAKAALLRMPRQAWTDIEQAAICQTQFGKGITDAANRDFTWAMTSASSIDAPGAGSTMA